MPPKISTDQADRVYSDPAKYACPVRNNATPWRSSLMNGYDVRLNEQGIGELRPKLVQDINPDLSQPAAKEEK